MKDGRPPAPDGATSRWLPKSKSVVMRFDLKSFEVMNAAANLLMLNLTDFLRLALRQALMDLPTLCFQAASVRAQQLFITKAEKRWGKPFPAIDFNEKTVLEWVKSVELADADWNAPKRGNAKIAVTPGSGYPSMFENAKKDEYPEIFRTLTEYGEAFQNPPDGPDRELFRTMLVTFNPNNLTGDQESDLAEAKGKVRAQIQNEFAGLKIKFQALPGLCARAKALGAAPEFCHQFRHDPHVLLRYVCWRELTEDWKSSPRDDSWRDFVGTESIDDFRSYLPPEPQSHTPTASVPGSKEVTRSKKTRRG